jgi:hypothetical protein
MFFHINGQCGVTFGISNARAQGLSQTAQQICFSIGVIINDF